MKKAILGIAIVASSLLLAGCNYSTDSSNGNQSRQLEINQEKIVKAVPIPQVDTSSDRKSIAKRAELFADENKVSYVYLVSYGKVMAFYPIKGKVVSIKSYMTPQEQIVNRHGVPCTEADSSGSTALGCGTGGYTTVQAPDIDGTYGDNADAVFFFTTEGAYVEWAGEYMVSDQPLRLTTQPELVRQIE